MIAFGRPRGAVMRILGPSRLFTWLGKRQPVEDKPAWGKHSPIDLLADSLGKSPEGWVLKHNAIQRNGVVISWHGPVAAARTTISVKMDGQRFAITATESKYLKERLIEFLRVSRFEAD